MGARVWLEGGSCGESRQQPLPLAASPVLTRVGVTKGQASCASQRQSLPSPGGRSDAHAAHLRRSEDSRSLQG